jgi:hypothetical protein
LAGEGALPFEAAVEAFDTGNGNSRSFLQRLFENQQHAPSAWPIVCCRDQQMTCCVSD